MKLLLVGDPHVTVEELEDSQNLLDGVLKLVETSKPDAVVFLGDQHHNHAVVRVEVTDFWLRNLKRFDVNVIMLVGNHDRPNDASSNVHALQPYTYLPNVTVVDKPTIIDGIAYMPYIHGKEDFQRSAFELSSKAKILICHQTFDGSKYENGFYAPDGVDPAMTGFETVYSGHIHTTQTVLGPSTKIIYIGSPRWRTVSDANDHKAVAMVDTVNETCLLTDTENWCSPISKTTVTTESNLDSLPFHDNPKARHHIDAMALSSEMEALIIKIRNKYPRAKIRPIPIDKKVTSMVRESDGVFNALRRFVESSKPPHGTDPNLLRDLVARRLNVN